MRRSKFFVLRVFIFWLIILCISYSAFARICGNGAGGGYGGEGEGTGEKSTLIETYLADGAAYFLKADSDILLFLNKIESSDLIGINYSESLSIMDSAYKNMVEAKTTYEKLIKTAQETPYNDAVLTRLLNFSYDEFLEKNHLNPAIFKEVEGYLKKGDITGAFINIYGRFCGIIEKINYIKGSLYMDNMPGITNLWRLNQDCFETMLFGQYISEIFNEIR